MYINVVIEVVVEYLKVVSENTSKQKPNKSPNHSNWNQRKGYYSIRMANER